MNEESKGLDSGGMHPGHVVHVWGAKTQSSTTYLLNETFLLGFIEILADRDVGGVGNGKSLTLPAGIFDSERHFFGKASVKDLVELQMFR